MREVTWPEDPEGSLLAVMRTEFTLGVGHGVFLVEMGESRTPRPRDARRGCTTSLSGDYLTIGQSTGELFDRLPLILGAP